MDDFGNRLLRILGAFQRDSKVSEAVTALDALFAERAEALAENLEATLREWSAQEPEEASPCDAAEEHNCHLVAGELAFNEAIRQVREIAAGAIR